MSEWKKIWNKRGIENENEISELKNNPQKMSLRMKELNGFDVVDGGMTYDALFCQYTQIKNKMSIYNSFSSIYEVGCGCGANLYLFQNDSFKIGGIDYSAGLIDYAKKALNDESVLELDCDEAINMNTDIIYDACLSNSVFSYFPDYDYAEKVLDKMLSKSRNCLALIDIHDVDKKDDFLEYRRKLIKDYDERYRNLPKLFYSKDFFKNFANKNNLEIVFEESSVTGYWNNEFVFECYMYRK